MTTVENPPVNGDTAAPTSAAGNPIGFGHMWQRPRRVRTRHSVRERAEGLRRDGAPFGHAQVVLADRPTSAKPRDEALVLADGTIEGIVGGTGAESTVRAQSLALLDSGDSLRISPVEEAAQPGKLTVTKPCLSGGTIEVFLEPVMPGAGNRRAFAADPAAYAPGTGISCDRRTSPQIHGYLPCPTPDMRDTS